MRRKLRRISRVGGGGWGDGRAQEGQREASGGDIGPGNADECSCGVGEHARVDSVAEKPQGMSKGRVW